MVVAGNNHEIPLLGLITLRFTINTRSAYHEYGVVKDLPIDMLIGGEFLRPHVCQIIYEASGRDVFGIKDGCCEKCARNKDKLKAEHDPQLHTTPKRTPAKRRNLSCVAVPTCLPDEQERKREKLCKVIEELRIEQILQGPIPSIDVVLSEVMFAYTLQQASLPTSLCSVWRRAYPARFSLAYPKWNVQRLPTPSNVTRNLA